MTEYFRVRLDAFEMLYWQRLLRIPWTAERANASILCELTIRERFLQSASVCRTIFWSYDAAQ